MTRIKYTILSLFALYVVATLFGCGSTDSGTALSEQNQVAKLTSVTIAARFPTTDGAVKSLIPDNAQVIEVYALSMPYVLDPINPNPNGTLIATLTPAVASKTVQINPGTYMINARAYSSTDIATRVMVGQSITGGEIKSGQSNTIVLTFMNGQWTLVSPIVLSNGTQLNDFIVNSDIYSTQLTKSSIDYTKPVGGGSSTIRLRFNNNTSVRTSAGMASQFIGTANSTIIDSSSYNLSKKCDLSYYYGLPCDEGIGDQIIMISGKDVGNGSQQSGSIYEIYLFGSAQDLLPSKGQTTFSMNGQVLDLMSVLPDTIVSGGNVITGGIIEWLPATNRITTLATSVTAKVAKSATAALASNQSTNTAYLNITTKSPETIVCADKNPQNRGSWSFANNSSAGKVLLGGRVCYNNYPSLSSTYNPLTGLPVTDSGDYSYGLTPTNTTNLGDYCQQWNYSTNICLQQLPASGDIFYPYNFRAVKSATKTSINYGSFKLNFWAETTQTGSAYVYPFTANGSTTVTRAK